MCLGRCFPKPGVTEHDHHHTPPRPRIARPRRDVYRFRNQRHSGADLTEIERAELAEEWFGVLGAMCGVEATTRAGLKIKAGAIIICFARLGRSIGSRCRSRATSWPGGRDDDGLVPDEPNLLSLDPAVATAALMSEMWIGLLLSFGLICLFELLIRCLA